jgi:hypothetical protein
MRARHRSGLLSKTKTLLQFFGVLIMLTAYMALFYNASAEDNGLDSSDLYKGNINLLYLFLTIALGVSQGVEIYDHAIGHHHHHDHSHDDETELKSASFLISPNVHSINSLQRQSQHLSPIEITIRSAVPLTLGGFGCYAIWNQVLSFAQEDLRIAIPVFVANMFRFILLPGQHVKALVTGTEHELMHTVTATHDDEEGLSTSSLKKIFLFLLYASCHIADSQLLANQTSTQSAVYWLSVVGLSCSNACYHVTHSLNIGPAYKKFKKLSCGKKMLALTLSFLTGGLHASQSLLGLFHLIKTNQHIAILGVQGLATLVEFFTGSIDSLQHLGQRATDSIDALTYTSLWATSRVSAEDMPPLEKPDSSLLSLD